MYDKLLKTSKEMNMTVLSKLLEAHRQTSTVVTKASPPVVLNKNASSIRAQPRVFHQQQKTLPTKTVLYKQGQTVIRQVAKPNIPEPIRIVTHYQQDKNNSRPARFNVPEEIIPESEGSFENISYESKPVVTAQQLKRDDENSPFESLKRGYTNNNVSGKRVASATESPPAKKPNLDDIKAEAEAQRQRTELGSDEEEDDNISDDPDYDGDNYFEENDDSEDEDHKKTTKSSPSNVVKQSATKQITVNDLSGGNIDHARILSEVLKKYPNLVKNPKNIRLKIMQKPSDPNSPQTATAIVRVVKQESSNQSSTSVTRSTSQLSTTSTGPRKIDAKTMHELIRLGAENMKGPWLCLDCGSGGRPISIPTYKKYRAHLINIHKQKIDPRICEFCGLKPTRRIELVQHQLIAHNVNPPADVQLFRCSTKNCVFVTQKEDLLMKHKREVHKEFQQKCKYCPKVFGKEFLLHAHMRAVHRHMAKTDGNEFSEDDEYDPEGNQKKKENNKIEILSNIEIPADSAIKFDMEVSSQPSSEAEALTNVASGIATSLALVDNATIEDQFNIEQQLAQVHGEFEDVKKDDMKLVAEDGTELELTAAQKEEIIQQLQSQGATLANNVVMVLDQSQLIYTSDGQEASVVDQSTINNIKPEEIEKAEVVFGGSEIDSAKVDAEKSQLISELENDWTEEEELPQNDTKTIETTTEAIVEDKKVVEEPPKSDQVNDKLKDILDDWNDDDVDMKNDEIPEKSESSKIDEISTDITSLPIDVEPPKIDEVKTSTDEKIELPEVPSLDEKINQVSETKQVEEQSEKSKMINDLLDEWNDDDL